MTASTTALIVVDVQNDFCEGGSMGVDGGAAVAANISELVAEQGGERYRYIVATRDWHIEPGDHWAPEGHEPDFVNTWPRHCEAETTGAAFHDHLTVDFDEIFSKGATSASFSGFEGFAGTGASPLAKWLRDNEIQQVDVVGIATDYCVKATALDAHANGFATRVLADYCAAVASETGVAALAELAEQGIEVVRA